MVYTEDFRVVTVVGDYHFRECRQKHLGVYLQGCLLWWCILPHSLGCSVISETPIKPRP